MHLLTDFLYTLRGFGRRPGYALVIVLTLALGIGANSAMFSIIKGVLLEPLPYEAPDQLAFIWNQFPGSGEEEIQLSHHELLDWRTETEIFADVAAINTNEQMAVWTLTFNDKTEVHDGAFATSNLFDVMGVGAALGRTFIPDDGVKGQDKVVVLSDGVWRQRFAADPDILGRTLIVRGESRVVVGVMPRGFHTDLNVVDAREADFWVPLVFNLDFPREFRWLTVVGRLRPGVTPTQANAHAVAVATAFKDTYPDVYTEDSGYAIHVESLPGRIVGTVRTPLLVLLGTVGLVLLIACLNVVNLLLIRGEYRQREIAVRIAVGANWRRVAQLFLWEGLILTGVGGLAGLLVGYGQFDDRRGDLQQVLGVRYAIACRSNHRIVTVAFG